MEEPLGVASFVHWVDHYELIPISELQESRSKKWRQYVRILSRKGVYVFSKARAATICKYLGYFRHISWT